MLTGAPGKYSRQRFDKHSCVVEQCRERTTCSDAALGLGCWAWAIVDVVEHPAAAGGYEAGGLARRRLRVARHHAIRRRRGFAPTEFSAGGHAALANAHDSYRQRTERAKHRMAPRYRIFSRREDLLYAGHYRPVRRPVTECACAPPTPSGCSRASPPNSRSISCTRCLTMSPIDTMPISRPWSTTGTWRNLPVGHALHDAGRPFRSRCRSRPCASSSGSPARRAQPRRARRARARCRVRR